jgi:hypothetical protein
MRKLCTWYYYFLCTLAWIFGWPILLILMIKEHLTKGDKENDEYVY